MTDGGPFLHWCSAPGCREWGAFGYGVFRGKEDQGVYRCAAHRITPKATPKPDPAPAAPAAKPSKKPVQGGLF